jgi:hypothetical protein
MPSKEDLPKLEEGARKFQEKVMAPVGEAVHQVRKPIDVATGYYATKPEPVDTLSRIFGGEALADLLYPQQAEVANLPLRREVMGETPPMAPEIATEALLPTGPAAGAESGFYEALGFDPSLAGADEISGEWGKAVARPVVRTATGLATDPIIPMLPLARGVPAVARGISGYFAGTMGAATAEAAQEAGRRLGEKMDTEGLTPDALEMIVDTAISAYFTKAAGKHAIKGHPKPGEVPDPTPDQILAEVRDPRAASARKQLAKRAEERREILEAEEAKPGARPSEIDRLVSEAREAKEALRARELQLKQAKTVMAEEAVPAEARTVTTHERLTTPEGKTAYRYAGKVPEADLHNRIVEHAKELGKDGVRVADIVDGFNLKPKQAQRVLQKLERQGRLTKPEKGVRRVVEVVEPKPPAREPRPAPETPQKEPGAPLKPARAFASDVAELKGELAEEGFLDKPKQELKPSEDLLAALAEVEAEGVKPQKRVVDIKRPEKLPVPEKDVPWNLTEQAGERTIYVDPWKVFDLAQEDIHRPGRARQKVGRGVDKLDRASDFLKHAEERGVSVDTPELQLSPEGVLEIGDGFHRMMAAADLGHRRIPVRVGQSELAEIRALGVESAKQGARPGRPEGEGVRGLARPEKPRVADAARRGVQEGPRRAATPEAQEAKQRFSVEDPTRTEAEASVREAWADVQRTHPETSKKEQRRFLRQMVENTIPDEGNFQPYLDALGRLEKTVVREPVTPGKKFAVDREAPEWQARLGRRTRDPESIRDALKEAYEVIESPENIDFSFPDNVYTPKSFGVEPSEAYRAASKYRMPDELDIKTWRPLLPKSKMAEAVRLDKEASALEKKGVTEGPVFNKLGDLWGEAEEVYWEKVDIGIAETVKAAQQFRRKYEAEAARLEAQGKFDVAEPGKPVKLPTEKEVQRVFPKAKVDRVANNWRVTLPDGRTIYVLERGHVVLPRTAAEMADFRRQYGRDAESTEIAKAVFDEADRGVSIPLSGVISLAKGRAGLPELKHEAFHAAVNMALKPRDLAILRKRFGGKDDWEERAARAYEKWDGKPEGAPLFQKIRAPFARMWKALGSPTEAAAERVFEKVGEFEPARPGVPAKGVQKFAAEPAPRPEGPREPGTQAVEPSPGLAKPEQVTPRMKRILERRERLAKNLDRPRHVLKGAVRGLALADETRAEAFIRNIQDRMVRVSKQQEQIKAKGGRLTEANDVTMHEEIFPGRTETRLEDFGERYQKPVEKLLRKSDITPESAGEYLYALFAPDRNARIKKINPELGDAGSGMTNAEAATLKRKYETGKNAKAYKEMAGVIHKAMAFQRKLLLESGLETKETLDAWEAANGPMYVPLKTFEVVEGAIGTGRRYDIRGKEARTATGRTTLADNPLANALAQVQQTIVRAEKNRVEQAMLKLVEDNPDPNLWTIDVRPDKPVINKKTGMVEYKKDPLYQLGDDVVAVKRDGQVHLIHFKGDKLLAQAMKGLGAGTNNWVVRNMATLTRAFSAIVTTYSPGFLPTNFARDIQTALVHVGAEKSGKIAAQVAKDTLPAVRGMYRGLRGKAPKGQWQQLAREFKEDGGQIGFFGLKDAEQILTKMEYDMTSAVPESILPGRAGKVSEVVREKMKPATKPARDQFRKLTDWVDHANRAVENGVRLSAYANMRKAGMTRQKAAQYAKNLTVNFNKKGEMSSNLNAWYAFFNAGVQGTARMKKFLSTRRGFMGAAAIVAAGGVMDTLNRAVAGDADNDKVNDYDAIPDFVKERNWIVMRGEGKKPLIIPMPYGYSVLHALGRNASAWHAKAKSPAAMAKDLTMAALGSFNPLGGESSVLQVASPTAGDPWVQMWMNENFAGNAIYPTKYPGQEGKPDSQMYFSTATTASRRIAQGMNEITGGDTYTSGMTDISPETIDHLMAYVTGGLGKFVGRALDTSARVYKGETPPIRNVPIVRRFLYDEHPAAMSMRYKENMAEMEDIERRYKGYKSEGNRAMMATFPRPMLQALSYTNKVSKEIRRLRREGVKYDDERIRDLQRKAIKMIQMARARAEAEDAR